MKDIVKEMEERLTSLKPCFLKTKDNGALHNGHHDNMEIGHYSIIIVSDAFNYLPIITRDLLVYNVMNTLMHYSIHALSIKTKTLIACNMEAHGDKTTIKTSMQTKSD